MPGQRLQPVEDIQAGSAEAPSGCQLPGRQRRSVVATAGRTDAPRPAPGPGTAATGHRRPKAGRRVPAAGPAKPGPEAERPGPRVGPKAERMGAGSEAEGPTAAGPGAVEAELPTVDSDLTGCHRTGVWGPRVAQCRWSSPGRPAAHQSSAAPAVGRAATGPRTPRAGAPAEPRPASSVRPDLVDRFPGSRRTRFAVCDRLRR